MPRLLSENAIRKQIAALQERLKKSNRGRAAAVKAIVKQMRKHDIGVDELRAASAGRATQAASRDAPARQRAKARIKYRDENGNTWTGRGRSPRWLVAAEAADRKREEFLV